MKSIRTPECICLSCKRKIDSCSEGIKEKRMPKKNDVTICLYCGHIMAFKKNLTLRQLTDKELLKVAGNENILAIQKARSYILKDKKL